MAAVCRYACMALGIEPMDIAASPPAAVTSGARVASVKARRAIRRVREREEDCGFAESDATEAAPPTAPTSDGSPMQAAGPDGKMAEAWGLSDESQSALNHRLALTYAIGVLTHRATGAPLIQVWACLLPFRCCIGLQS